MIRLVIADDQALLRAALATTLELQPDFTVVAAVGRGDDLIAAVDEHDPDVALVDIEMPGLDGLSATASITAGGRATRVLVVTTFGRAGYLRRAMEAGAAGFLVKDTPPEELADAIRRVHAGERVVDPGLAADSLALGASPLTARERDVLSASRGGSTIADIAARLNLSEGTVRNYLSSAITKLGARNRVEAATVADASGWL